MDRREWLLAAGAATLAAASGAAGAADEHEHMHHHHGAAPNHGLIDATAECTKVGQACLAHCLVLLGQGETEMAPCAQSVSQMLAVCGALQQLAAQQSKQLPRLAALAADLCKDCEAECRKHEQKHAECKACAEACSACQKECRAIAA